MADLAGPVTKVPLVYKRTYIILVYYTCTCKYIHKLQILIFSVHIVRHYTEAIYASFKASFLTDAVFIARKAGYVPIMEYS